MEVQEAKQGRGGQEEKRGSVRAFSVEVGHTTKHLVLTTEDVAGSEPHNLGAVVEAKLPTRISLAVWVLLKQDFGATDPCMQV